MIYDNIQSKIEVIKNEKECIKTISEILLNSENSSIEEIKEIILDIFSEFFHVSNLVEEWFEYARTTYIRLKISKNSSLNSVTNLNATIFVYSFIQKFFK